MFKRTNSEPSPGSQKGPQTDSTPKGRYKSVLLTPSQSLPSSPSALTPGFLRSFGFANTRSSSQPGKFGSTNIFNQISQHWIIFNCWIFLNFICQCDIINHRLDLSRSSDWLVSSIFEPDSGHEVVNFDIKWWCLLFFVIPLLYGACIKLSTLNKQSPCHSPWMTPLYQFDCINLKCCLIKKLIDCMAVYLIL